MEVSGGGSGQGIAALIKGNVDLASCSRNLKPEEAEEARKNTGKDPVEHVVAYDALAIFVHSQNPLEEITLSQLAEIYKVGGNLARWSQLGATIPSGRDRIMRVNRQSSSGTYEFFRDHVLDKKDFQLGSLDMNGSKEVVELIAATPGAIGYSGMAFATDQVKVLRVSAGEGKQGLRADPFQRSIETVSDLGAISCCIPWANHVPRLAHTLIGCSRRWANRLLPMLGMCPFGTARRPPND